MISVKDAVQIVLDNTPVMDVQEVDLKDSLGLRLSDDIVADMNMPPFNRSAMDGYALISGDVSTIPAELAVIETIPAGYQPTKQVQTGQASKIMTGAIVPAGADSVMMVEDTEPLNDGNRVKILKEIKKGKNIAEMGEDMQEGQVVLAGGKRIRPQEFGVLASVGANRVRVFRPPSIGIIATGDELVSINRKPQPGQIRNSNSYSIAAQAMQASNGTAPATIMDIAPDDTKKAAAIIESGLHNDILVLSGGVSMGDFDIIGNVLAELGTEIFFEKVSLRPGKPTLFGKNGKTIIFALPGNPVATFVTFELFVHPAMQKMMGAENPERIMIEAVLEKEYINKRRRTEFRPAYIRQSGEKPSVAPVKWHGSADLLSMTNANCLIEFPEGVEVFPSNHTVNVAPLF